MLPQAITLINRKGGTFKTSLTANVGGLIAKDGYRVLAVDMDPQGNLGRDLGYYGTDGDDDGLALLEAATGRRNITPIRDVRPGLDVVCGGGKIEDLLTENAHAIDRAIAPLVGDYDVILLDCPPGNRLLQQMALTAAHYVVIPTKADAASLDGLRQVAQLFMEIRQDQNPDLDLLGVVLCGVGGRSHRIAEDARASIAEMLRRPDIMFAAQIRFVEGPAQDCRRLGRLVHEIQDDMGASRREVFAWLRKLGDGAAVGKHRPQRIAESAPGLAGDYQRLVDELTARMVDRSAVPA